MTLPASLPKPKKPKLFWLRRVSGDSMLPALRPRAIVLVVRPHRLRCGDIVVVAHNGLEKIKRIADIQDGKVFVQGDNLSASTDSRHFGWLSTDLIVAKVVWPMHRPQHVVV